MSVSTRDFERVYDLIMAGWASQTVRTLASLSVAEHLADGPMTAAQLAAAESCDASAMYRLLRAATPLGLIHYDDLDRTFCATPLLSVLDARSAVSLKNYAQAAIGPCFWLPALRLTQAVRGGEPQAEPSLGSSVFEWMTAHPDAARQFAAAMSDLSAPIIKEAVEHIDTSGALFAVDVGGAEGAFISALLAASPQLLGLVLDLEAVIPSVAAEAERCGLGDRMRGVAGDFLHSVPAGDLYLLKFVLHDWDDDACRAILGNISKAMRPGARLWIVEMVADSGNVPAALATMDMAMLFASGGQERELAQFDGLIQSAGLAIVAVTPLTTPYQLIEVRAA